MRFILFALATTALVTAASAQPTLTHVTPPPPANLTCPVATPGAQIVANAHVMQGMNTAHLQTAVTATPQASEQEPEKAPPPSNNPHNQADHQNDDGPKPGPHQNSQAGQQGVLVSSDHPGALGGGVSGGGVTGGPGTQGLLVSSSHASGLVHCPSTPNTPNTPGANAIVSPH